MNLKEYLEGYLDSEKDFYYSEQFEQRMKRAAESGYGNYTVSTALIEGKEVPYSEVTSLGETPLLMQYSDLTYLGRGVFHKTEVVIENDPIESIEEFQEYLRYMLFEESDDWDEVIGD